MFRPNLPDHILRYCRCPIEDNAISVPVKDLDHERDRCPQISPILPHNPPEQERSVWIWHPLRLPACCNELDYGPIPTVKARIQATHDVWFLLPSRTLDTPPSEVARLYSQSAVEHLFCGAMRILTFFMATSTILRSYHRKNNFTFLYILQKGPLILSSLSPGCYVLGTLISRY